MGGASVAHADTVDQANAQAQRIAVGISKLQPQVDAALAAYDSALNAVGQAVSSNVAAQRVYTSLQAQADAWRRRATDTSSRCTKRRPVALYAAVLQSGQPADLHQLPYLRGIVMPTQRARQRVAGRGSGKGHRRLDPGCGRQRAGERRPRQPAPPQSKTSRPATGVARRSLGPGEEPASLEGRRGCAGRVTPGGRPSWRPGRAGVATLSDPAAVSRLYQKAATTCPGLSWTVLAAIGQVETHHGSGTMVSSAGALGPMQFLPSTFVQYARDGDHDGKANIVNPADAIYSAAAYLCANGAGPAVTRSTARCGTTTTPTGTSNSCWRCRARLSDRLRGGSP